VSRGSLENERKSRLKKSKSYGRDEEKQFTLGDNISNTNNSQRLPELQQKQTPSFDSFRNGALENRCQELTANNRELERKIQEKDGMIV
jgi:hypothetical protein